MNNPILPFIVFPIGYDPMIAGGPPDEDCVKKGITWTPEETERCRAMEHQVEEILSERGPVGRWSCQTTKAEFLALLPKPELDYQI